MTFIRGFPIGGGGGSGGSGVTAGGGGGPWISVGGIAASVTASQLIFASLSSGMSKYLATRSGSIVGLAALLSTAAAGAGITIAVYINGVASAISESIAIAGTTVTATYAQGTHTFAADDQIDVRVTTNGSWTSTTANIKVELDFQLD